MEEEKIIPNTESGAESEEKVSYSADEVKALLQAEGDRRVSGARRKWERESREATEAEARRIACEMTDELIRETEELHACLELEREKSHRREREISVMHSLEKRSLPVELLPLIMAVDEESTEETADTLSRIISECASRETEKRLLSSKPRASSKGICLSSEEILNTPVAKLQELMG